MRLSAFALRNIKEILRDPINLFFGLGFPVVLLLLLTAIQANIPASLFELESLTPGVAVFGLSFISLFAGTLISKDRSTSFLIRLFASPLSAADFILGYILPLLPIAVAQGIICYLLAFILGLTPTVNVILALLTLIPAEVLFIGIGLLAGTLFNDKQVGGLCGALLTNLCGWLSSTWFDVALVGGAFEKIANCLPFVHAVEAGRAALEGDLAAALPHIIWVGAYAIVIMTAAIVVFGRKMSSDKM